MKSAATIRLELPALPDYAKAMIELPHKLLAATGLLLSAPLCASVGAAIWIAEGRPVFFTQQRLGRRRVPFTIFKFRTMSLGQVTPLGRHLRRWRLDELPQLINVVRGEMRLVGPRPITEDDVARLGWQDARYDGRWSVPPGMTGPTQLSRICNAAHSMRLDLWYVENAGALVDTHLLLRTFKLPSPLAAFAALRTLEALDRLSGHRTCDPDGAL